MLVLINGNPGTGKLTIGKNLSEQIGGRLLDVHTVYNLSLALADHKSEEFFSTIRKIWSLADDLMAVLPHEQPIVFTEALADGSDWASETWSRYLRLGEARGPLYVVHLHCSLEENIRRIISPGRLSSRKPVDADYARHWHSLDRPLVGRTASKLLTLDVTNLSVETAATHIREWIQGQLSDSDAENCKKRLI
jgi:hypothetical protein